MARLCVRGFARWTHRSPVKIYYPELQGPDKEPTLSDAVDLGSMDQQRIPKTGRRNFRGPYTEKKQKPLNKSFDFDEIDKLTHSFPKISNPEHPEIKSKSVKNNKNKVHNILSQAKRVFYEDGNFTFNRLPSNDTETSNLFIKMRSKKDHGHCGLILVEGWRLIADGLQAGCVLKKIYFSQLSDLDKLKPHMPAEGPDIYKLPYKEMQSWSNLDTCPGIMGIFVTPKPETIKKAKDILPINIICDNIRDPGNMGAILRASLGVGCAEVLLTKGCVNIWDPKVLRSAAGAHFRLPMIPDLSWRDIEDKSSDNTLVVIADNNCNKKIINLEEPKSFFHSERSKSFVTTDKRSATDNDENIIESKTAEVPFLPYYEANFSSPKSISIIIGGETEGVSENSYRFAHLKNGLRLNIPLSNGVDSLNTGMALAVIAFEIKRQILIYGTDQASKITAKN